MGTSAVTVLFVSTSGRVCFACKMSMRVVPLSLTLSLSERTVDFPELLLTTMLSPTTSDILFSYESSIICQILYILKIMFTLLSLLLNTWYLPFLIVLARKYGMLDKRNL